MKCLKVQPNHNNELAPKVSGSGWVISETYVEFQRARLCGLGIQSSELLEVQPYHAEGALKLAGWSRSQLNVFAAQKRQTGLPARIQVCIGQGCNKGLEGDLTFEIPKPLNPNLSGHTIVDPRYQLRGTFALHNSVPEGAFMWIAAGTLNSKP